jgi:choline dehydrogenase-like flavoprotein
MQIELRGRHADALPDVAVRVVSDRHPPMLRSVLRRLSALGPALDLFPVIPMVRQSGPGKSYHFGSTFPHGDGSDMLGRVGGIPDVHLIDGSVLPSVPSTTFTLTVMANAHRIVMASHHV